MTRPDATLCAERPQVGRSTIVAQLSDASVALDRLLHAAVTDGGDEVLDLNEASLAVHRALLVLAQ